MLNVITRKENKNKTDLFKVIHYAIIQISQDHYKSLEDVLDPNWTSELVLTFLKDAHPYLYKQEFIDVVFFTVEIYYVEIA